MPLRISRYGPITAQENGQERVSVGSSVDVAVTASPESVGGKVAVQVSGVLVLAIVVLLVVVARALGGN
jgi:hypothetical protein